MLNFSHASSRSLRAGIFLIESGEYETIIREWKSLSCTLENRVQIRTLKNSFEGDAIDIDEFGALIIRKDNGKLERVISGDCYQL